LRTPWAEHWLKVLKADKRAIVMAASKAQQAADWPSAGRAKQFVTFDPVAYPSIGGPNARAHFDNS
jgi:hypothetical protein